MFIKVGDSSFTLYECNSFYSRFKGLMFTKNIDYAVKFSRCNSIHTCFMLENIDVIMTDINNNILYVFKNLKPWRFILPKKNVCHVYELPAGSINDNIIEINIGG